VSTGFRNTVAIIVFLIVLGWAMASAKAEGAGRHRNTRAICHVFGRYCDQALRVSWCESHWLTTARNGQYLGLFQMGSWERRRFGHGADAWSQARAALRYFNNSGRDWSPWSCQP
jgi:hypothetical protein